MDTGYVLKCIDGEAEGQRLPIQDQMKLGLFVSKSTGCFSDSQRRRMQCAYVARPASDG